MCSKCTFSLVWTFPSLIKNTPVEKHMELKIKQLLLLSAQQQVQKINSFTLKINQNGIKN